jgi:SAM-dependent methyltransferase
VEKELVGIWHDKPPVNTRYAGKAEERRETRKADGSPMMQTFGSTSATITGESCACPTPDAPTRPAVVLDPFAGTGTTVAVANALGRYGVGIDLSADYLKLARWRCQDRGLRAKALGVDKPAPEVPGQMALL